MLVASESALENLVRRVLALRKLSDALATPLRVRLDAVQLAGLNRIASGLGVRPFSLRDADDAAPWTSFEQLALAHLAIDRELEAQLGGGVDLDGAIDYVRNTSLETVFARTEVETTRGTVLNAYAGGARGGDAVLLVPACGMPIELSESWMRELGRSHFILTWETRGLFGRCDDFDVIAHDVTAQADDLLAVMNHFDLRSTHLMGLCGGAVIALAAAAASPERFSSLSLWYGDYHLADAAPKTKHQRELTRLLAMVRAGRQQATALQRLFRDPSMLASVPRDVAHLVMYPYADGELLYRYAILNGAIMEHDVRETLTQIGQPTLVVTSEDDATAHPEGSRHVAQGIARAQLHVEPHGDHLTLFGAGAEIAALARDFIATA
jgi:3-oxoadipate enol-lactonase